MIDITYDMKRIRNNMNNDEKGTNVNSDICIQTGEMIANKGDYIIKGIKDEIYPCKADIFEATYEKVKSV